MKIGMKHGYLDIACSPLCNEDTSVVLCLRILHRTLKTLLDEKRSCGSLDSTKNYYPSIRPVNSGN